MLHCRNISYHAGERALLSAVDLDVRPGEILSILGPNGAGKSTLLKLLSGELTPSAGAVSLDHRPLKSIGPGVLASRRAVVPQSSHLSFAFTVLEVVMLGISVPGFQKGDSAPAKQAALNSLEHVGLSEFAQRFYPNLSGGEKQRVQIARALCQLAYAARSTDDTQYLLLDEATANLDIAHQNLICRLLQSQARNGRASVLVAHDLNLAAELSNRVALMKAGRVVALGPVQDIYRDGLLSEVYDCPLRVEVNGNGKPMVHAERGLQATG